MEIKIKSVLAAVPKDVDDTGRIVGFKKFAGRAAVVVILDELRVQQTGDFASIPIGCTTTPEINDATNIAGYYE